MKTTYRIIFAAVLGLAAGTTATAQDDNNNTADNQEVEALKAEVEQLKKRQADADRRQFNYQRQVATWHKSSPVMVTYGNQRLKDETLDVEYKSDFSFSVSKRHTYDLHQQGIAGMVKFGLDVSWLDINVARYAKGKGLSLSALSESLLGNVTSGTFNTFEDYFNAADHNALAAADQMDISDMLNRIDLGKYQISANVVGIGPSVRVVPFYPIGKSWLDKIKVGLYVHYVPTFSALIFTCEDEDPVVCGGYMSCWRYGGNIVFGRVGIGVEHQWGKGNLKKFNFGSKDDGDGIDISSEKVKYALSGTRFYVGYNF